MSGATTEGEWEPAYQINAYDHSQSPVITSKDPGKIQMFHWGLIPHRTKNIEDAAKIRTMTLMARSEEMYEKSSYAELAKAGKRCIIPTTGYFEHRTVGKNKFPYFIFLKDKPIFSIGGLYSRWINPADGKEHYTYCICTTRANELTSIIHNKGLRMPVILPDTKSEQKWLDTKLPQEEVLKLCEPLPASLMDAYTVSKVITSKTPNVKEAIEPYPYPELNNEIRVVY